MTVEFGSSSSINGSNEMLGCKPLPLSHARYIEDGHPNEAASLSEVLSSCNVRRSIFIKHFRCGHASSEVHLAHFISAVITPNNMQS